MLAYVIIEEVSNVLNKGIAIGWFIMELPSFIVVVMVDRCFAIPFNSW